MSSRVRAKTLAPAVAPLWAMGVAMAMLLFQLWFGPPGMFDGKRSTTVGTTHEMSPMSSDPPPRRCESGMSSRPRSSPPTSVGSPRSSTPSSFCRARASRWSFSLHAGMPTSSMLACTASASGRFMCCGHAAPRTRDSTVVAVMRAAPSAIWSPISHMRMMLG